jgi:hypothetical protein
MLPPFKWWAETEKHRLAEWRGYWASGILQTPEQTDNFEVLRRLDLISDIAVADADPRERLTTLEETMRTWATLDQESEQVRQKRQRMEAGKATAMMLEPRESNSSSSGSGQRLTEEQQFDFERAKVRASEKKSQNYEREAKR